MENAIDLNKLEVLSPAGNAECFFAALNNGADAIYLGLSNFNARMKAENFTTKNIREFVKKAHLHGVKIYVTINILLEDENFEELVNMVKILVDAKVDAYIVQDLGVAHVLKNAFEDIVLHASTQMGIHNLQGAKAAEQLGFSRVVLSRETTLEDIKQIKQNTSLEIEYFVQGALCVAFSGNCYLSSLENGASGNEGKCLQLCRLPYTNNVNGKSAYHLSARDLCLLDNLKTLIDAGVTSFKIEGRMRHAGYTATATHIYKSAIKQIATNSFNKTFINSAKKSLKESFSRGEFNNNAYLFRSKKNEIIYSDYQNHIGTKIGKVKAVQQFKNDLFKVEIESTHEIKPGDGLKIINNQTKEQVASLGVGNVEKLKNGNFVFFTKNKFSSGLDVHLTQNKENEENLLKNAKKIKINVKIIAKAGFPIKIFASNKFAKIEFETEHALEKSKTTPLSKLDIITQFSKISNTDFEIETITAETNDVFTPKSLLNEARRKMIELLEAKTIEENEKHLNAKFNESKCLSLFNQTTKTTPTNICVVENDNFEIAKNTIYVYSPENFVNCKPNEVLQKTKPENFAIELPTITNSKDFEIFENILKTLPKNISIYSNNIAGLNYALQGRKVIASPLMNTRNKFAIICLNKFNVTTICASIEAKTEFAEKNNLVFFSKGNFPLMTFAHCPYKEVTKTTCDSCKFNDSLTYTSMSKTTYVVRRTKLSNCYFTLNKPLNLGKFKFNITNFKHWTQFTCKTKK